MTASCLCKYGEGAGFPFQVESLEMEMIRSTLSTFTKQTMGRVRRRTSTQQRSITLVVRNLRRRWGTKAKNDSSSGRSCAKRRTMLAKGGRQRAWKARKVASARARLLAKWMAWARAVKRSLQRDCYPNILLRGGDLYENKRNGWGGRWESNPARSN